MMKKILLSLGALFLLSGCVPSVPEVDVSQAECETIEEFRMAVGAEFGAKMEVISDTYWQARRIFENNLNECMYDAWEGNPCDAEWEARTRAYEAAMSDISNEAAYQTYKQALAAWNACSADFDAAYENYAEQARAKEAKCTTDFEAAVANANAERDRLENEANTKKTSDLAALDALEERCRKAEEERLAQLMSDAQAAVALQRDVLRGGSTGHVYRPGSAACTGVIPGENSQARTGRPEREDLAMSVAREVLTQAAEAVTHTPIPTNAIDNRIFAIMVCAKLNTRLNELQIEEADAIGSNRRRELELREIISRYRQAKHVWCSIAAGNTSAQIRADADAIQSPEDEPQCASDSECGDPVCCSATEVGVWKCNEDGQCYTEKQQCPEDYQCSGRPGQCVQNPQTIQCIFYDGHLIPVENVHSGTGPECDQAAHWHTQGSALDINGVPVADPAPDGCGFGKVGEVPVVDVLVPAQSLEIRIQGGIFGN